MHITSWGPSLSLLQGNQAAKELCTVELKKCDFFSETNLIGGFYSRTLTVCPDFFEKISHILMGLHDFFLLVLPVSGPGR